MSTIYVGTYSKYNSGNLAGAWLDLEDYCDEGEFFAACRELHKDEDDPELMFQDTDAPSWALTSESSIHPLVFEYLALDGHEREVIDAYASSESIDHFGSVSDIIDIFYTRTDSLTDWAAEWCEEAGHLDGDCPHFIVIDWEATARNLLDGFTHIEYGGEHFLFTP